MSAIQLHLMLNHVPVIGVLLGTALLVYGLAQKNHEIQRFTLALFAILALISLPVYFTGESVEQLVESLPGISKSVVEPHEDAAFIALIGIELLGASAISGFFFFRRAVTYPKRFLTSILILSLFNAALMTWTAQRGGQIRHTELLAVSHLTIQPNGTSPHASSDDKKTH